MVENTEDEEEAPVPIAIKRSDYDVDGNLVEETYVKGDETMVEDIE